MLIPLISEEEYKKLRKPAPMILTSYDELPQEAKDGDLVAIVGNGKIEELVYNHGWVLRKEHGSK